MSLVQFRPEAPETEEAARRLKKEGRRAAGKQNADLAHLVERDLAKVEVAGSNPVIRSKGAAIRRRQTAHSVLCAVLFFFCTFLQSYKRTCGVRVLVCLGSMSPQLVCPTRERCSLLLLMLCGAIVKK